MSKILNGSRKRSENWTREERDIFLQIIKNNNYRDILDNMNTNANVNKLKNDAWNHITYRFQDLTQSNRNKIQLKAFWRRLKTAAKKRAKHKNNDCSNGDINKCDDFSSDNDSSTVNVDLKSNDINEEKTFLMDNSEVSNCRADNTNSRDKTEIVLLPYKNKNKQEDECDLKMNKDTDPDSWEKEHHNHNKVESDLMYKEFMLKRFYLRRYHKKELEHQNKKHQLEIENLMLERERMKLELEISKKKLELLLK